MKKVNDTLSLLTIQQLSDKYNISKSLLYKLTHRREIRYFKPNNGRVFIDEIDFLDWIQSSEVKSINQVLVDSKLG